MSDDKLSQALAEIERSHAECAEMNRVFELQRRRTHEATKLWRAAHPGSDDVLLPDLGELIGWLLQEREKSLRSANRLLSATFADTPENLERLAQKLFEVMVPNPPDYQAGRDSLMHAYREEAQLVLRGVRSYLGIND